MIPPQASHEQGVRSGTAGIALILASVVLGTATQLLFKAAADWGAAAGWAAFYRNPYLITGYLASGLSTVFMILAFKKGELSLLYPFVALTFVGVSLLSPVFFPTDHYNLRRLIGVAFIVAGVSLTGLGPRDAG